LGRIGIFLPTIEPVRRLFLLLSGLVVLGSLSGCSGGSTETDKGLDAAAKLGKPTSVSDDLMDQLAKRPPTTPAQDEANVRMLPGVMKSGNDAMDAVLKGGDSGKAVDKFQKDMANVPK